MKTKEELEQLKNEYESLNKKLSELSQDELKQVTGGGNYIVDAYPVLLKMKDVFIIFE